MKFKFTFSRVDNRTTQVSTWCAIGYFLDAPRQRLAAAQLHENKSPPSNDRSDEALRTEVMDVQTDRQTWVDLEIVALSQKDYRMA